MPNSPENISTSTLIIADIHLQPDPLHPINQAFKTFLNSITADIDALYILGDLFEMWVGDDIGLELYQEEIRALRKLVDNGIPVYLIYGNRDFLMRKKFEQASGIRILNDSEVVELYGTAYLMLHGDSLCTDDHGYQRMRKILRNRFVQFIFLNLCKKRRLKIGNKMRQSSQQHSQQKPKEIMDVNRQAVERQFQTHPQVEHMIHGHTHRPAHHQFAIAGRNHHRWVLGDWRPEAMIIKITESGPEMLKLTDGLLEQTKA